MGSVTAPGWYPDPAGGSRKRYWDGIAWHDAVPVRPGPAPAKGRSGWLTLGIFIGGALLLGVIVSIFSGHDDDDRASSYSEDEIQSVVVETCQQSVRNSLRDPDSAQFDQWKAWAAPNSKPPSGMTLGPGDKFYSGAGLVNAKNGFGGYAGNRPYGCSAVVTSTGDVNARANSLDGVLPGS